ncbi:tail fiber protein [Flammeovirga sp. SJP92]|uniref:tail fiber protein n=1 Tax=Flammeovirga sp. SJP92 TaxID=1775430 RepID=UPI000788C2C5|nr:tail fiber protein [Flammeovirga sp. SJP92]KXX71231.1 hypothetical protein AVL50_09245 [Flammeovirga sp. SJP92]
MKSWQLILTVLFITNTSLYAQENQISNNGKIGISTLTPAAKLSIGNSSNRIGLLHLDWVHENDWGGSAYKWTGFIGFNAYRNDNDPKGYYYRSNNYTNRLVIEGNNYGFHFLGEEKAPDFGGNTGSRKLQELFKINNSGLVSINNSMMNLGWTHENNWGGSSNKWSGFIGFNAITSDESAKDTYARINVYTRMNVFEGSNFGFRWLTELDIDRNTNVKELKEVMILNHKGYLGIGTSSPDSRLTVKGKIHAQEVKVTASAGTVPDYVFKEDYKMMPLADVEKYIKEYSHLPEVKSAKEIEEEGLHLAEMNLLLLKKVEELTLYIIEQQKQLDQQQKLIEKQAEILKQIINKKNDE